MFVLLYFIGFVTVWGFFPILKVTSEHSESW